MSDDILIIYESPETLTLLDIDDGTLVVTVPYEETLIIQSDIFPSSVGGAYEHFQNSPASTWTINHNLSYKPSVSIFSLGGIEIEAAIQHATNNQTIINFVVPTAGTATLS